MNRSQMYGLFALIGLFPLLATASPDPALVQKALLTTPETAVKIDTLFKSDFADQVIQCQVAANHCDVLPTGDFVNLNFTGQDMSGKRICVSNHILYYVSHLVGSPGDPAIIINCGGIGRITDTNKALWLRNSRYVRITGTGHSGHPIGLQLVGAHNTIDITQGSSDVQVDHVDVSSHPQGPSGSGISMRTYPTCENNQVAYTRPGFTQYNSVVKDSYIHDTWNEGLYIGTSHHHLANGFTQLDCDDNMVFEPTPQADLEGVSVANNVLYNIGGDGIQVGAAVADATIEDNVVLNFGVSAGAPDIQGIEANPGSLLEVKNNWIETQFPELSGVGLSIQGAGGSQYINNLFIGMHKGVHGLRSTGPANDAHLVWYNTFVLSGQSNAASIWCNSEVAVNQLDFANNLVINAQLPWADSQFGGTGCWQEAGHWLSDQIQDLGLADPANDAYWPVSGSVLIDQGVGTNPSIAVDFSAEPRITLEPGAYAVK